MVDFLARLRTKIAGGLSQAEAIALMRREGLSLIQAVKETRELFGLDLRTANEAVKEEYARPLPPLSPEEKLERMLREDQLRLGDDMRLS